MNDCLQVRQLLRGGTIDRLVRREVLADLRSKSVVAAGLFEKVEGSSGHECGDCLSSSDPASILTSIPMC